MARPHLPWRNLSSCAVFLPIAIARASYVTSKTPMPKATMSLLMAGCFCFFWKSPNFKHNGRQSHHIPRWFGSLQIRWTKAPSTDSSTPTTRFRDTAWWKKAPVGRHGFWVLKKNKHPPTQLNRKHPSSTPLQKVVCCTDKPKPHQNEELEKKSSRIDSMLTRSIAEKKMSQQLSFDLWATKKKTLPFHYTGYLTENPYI